MKKTIIAAFIVIFFLKLFLLFLDYRGSNSPELHNELLHYFTQEDIIKGESYARNGFGLVIARNIIFSFLILILSFSSLSGKLETFCRRLSNNRFLLTSVYFIAILYTLASLISIPFNFYFSYLSEHEFGFSNMTPGFWVWTWFKSHILVLVFVSITGSLALMAIKKFKFYSIFIVPVGGLVIGIAMLIIYPLVILPLFYEINPLDNPRLEKQIVEIARTSGVNVNKIYSIKESDYSKHTNAFFVGFGSNKKIYLYDTLIQNNSESELMSILAHEIGHWKYNHNMKRIIIGFVTSLGVFLIIFYCTKILLSARGFPGAEMYSPSLLPLYLMLYIILSSFTNPAEMAVSRAFERNADYYSLEITKDPDAFISSEIRIARDNKSRLNEHPLPACILDSHPMTIERIIMAEKFKRSMSDVDK